MATPIFGLRDSESLDRPLNWRRTILYAFPNGSAPLTAFLSLTKPEETNDPTFNWGEKDLPSQRALATASYTNVATSVAIAAATFNIGDMIMNEATEEVMKVTNISNDGLTLTVLRGNWGTPVASSGATDALLGIGNANAEGAKSRQSVAYDPDKYYNYTQIFRDSWNATGTESHTVTRLEANGVMPERQADALRLHSIGMEKAFIWSKRGKYTNTTTNKVERTTGGIYHDIPSTQKFTPSAGNLTQKLFDSYLEVAFRKSLSPNRPEKLALAGSGFISSMNTLFMGTGRVTLVPDEDTFGIQVYKYTSPFGDVYFNNHPLFTQHSVYRNQCMVLDFWGLKYRYLTSRDTTHRANIQDNDEDARKDEFLTEAGLEKNHVDANILIKGVTGVA